MKSSSTLAQRRNTARGLNLLAAAGIVLVLAAAATAMTVVGVDNSGLGATEQVK